MGGGNKITLELGFQASKFMGGNGLDSVGSGSEVRKEESLPHIFLLPYVHESPCSLRQVHPTSASISWSGKWAS